MALHFATTPAGQLMTFEATVSCVELITTTLAMKTWSFWVMERLAYNETPNLRTYHRSFYITCPLSRARAYMMCRMASCVAIC